MTSKEMARKLLSELPDSAEFPEILHRLQALASVEDGRKDLAQGQVESHEIVRREMERRWLDES